MVAKQDVKDAKFGDLEALENMTRQFACDGRSHRALESPSTAPTSRYDLNSRFRRNYCYKCGSTGHDISRMEVFKTTNKKTRYLRHVDTYSACRMHDASVTENRGEEY